MCVCACVIEMSKLESRSSLMVLPVWQPKVGKLCVFRQKITDASVEKLVVALNGNLVGTFSYNISD